MNDDYKDVSGLLEDDVSKVVTDEKVSVADKIDIGDKIEIVKPIIPIKPIRAPKFAAMRTMAEYSIPTPVTRKEMYLNVIAGGVSALPTPITREEIYLAKICGMDVAIPIPLTRYEMYLYKLAGGEWDVPAPVTRLEKYLYHNCGYEIEVPEPITREEIYWFGGQPVPEVLEGVPPLTFTAKRAGALIDYRIDGNTVQSGTPTPQNPIMPQGTGERTANLFDGQLQQGYYTYYTGLYVLSDAYVCTHLIPCTENTTYTFRCINTGGGSKNYGYVFFDSSQNRIGDDYINALTEGDVVTHTATTPQNTAFLAINIAYGSRQANVVRPSDITNFMLNLGSTPLPYEPYGIKIPISSASTTTPVYLGEVQSTRRIEELVLTGEENWVVDGGLNGLYSFNPDIKPYEAYNDQLCSHFPLADRYSTLYYNNNLFGFTSGVAGRLIIHYNAAQTTDAFKQYLAQQYAAGTPVTVWYVLATEETGIVNEPLMKIGNYADSVDFSQAGVEIPVTAGENTLSVGTTIQPSNMMISYK